MRVDIMGVGFDNLTMDEAVGEGMRLLCSDGADYIVTPNPEIVYESLNDNEFRDILNGAALVLPDGIGIIYAARILKTPLVGRVTGIEFAEGLMTGIEENGKGLFLFGGEPGVAEIAADNLVLRHPRLRICGTCDGYFDDDAHIVEKINSSGADCVFVCLGSPKQERWMAKRRGDLDASLLIGLGGSIDGFAGTVKRAPPLMRRLGLEWLYRLIKQPSRFTRMLRLPRFMLAVTKNRLGESK